MNVSQRFFQFSFSSSFFAATHGYDDCVPIIGHVIVRIQIVIIRVDIVTAKTKIVNSTIQFWKKEGSLLVIVIIVIPVIVIGVCHQIARQGGGR